MRISDWSSDVCSSDLIPHLSRERGAAAPCARPGRIAAAAGPACGKVGEAIGEIAMNDQPQIARPDSGKAAAPPPFAEPGVPHIRTLNIPGLQALYVDRKSTRLNSSH